MNKSSEIFDKIVSVMNPNLSLNESTTLKASSLQVHFNKAAQTNLNSNVQVADCKMTLPNNCMVQTLNQSSNTMECSDQIILMQVTQPHQKILKQYIYTKSFCRVFI